MPKKKKNYSVLRRFATTESGLNEPSSSEVSSLSVKFGTKLKWLLRYRVMGNSSSGLTPAELQGASFCLHTVLFWFLWASSLGSCSDIPKEHSQLIQLVKSLKEPPLGKISEALAKGFRGETLPRGFGSRKCVAIYSTGKKARSVSRLSCSALRSVVLLV